MTASTHPISPLRQRTIDDMWVLKPTATSHLPSPLSPIGTSIMPLKPHFALTPGPTSGAARVPSTRR